MERRHTPRIYEFIRATVSGADQGGTRFRFTTLLDNISGDGLYFYLPPDICPEADIGAEEGIRLFFIVELFGERSSACMAILGQVIRTERKASGACGVAVSFTNQRMLWDEDSREAVPSVAQQP